MNTTYWINEIMSTTFPSSGATGFYVGLSSTMPTAAGGNATEPSGNNYSRQAITAFTAPSNGVVSNAADIEFGRSSGIWFDRTNQCKYWVLFDGTGSGAHVLAAGTLQKPLTILGNATITFAAGAIKFTLTDAP